jgi:hypothetical protein
MAIKKLHYEESLAEYSIHPGAIALLRQYRPYFEMIPSLRRPEESLITIPLPIVQIRIPVDSQLGSVTRINPAEVRSLPCDVAILMCDPEWKVKTGVEIFIFIHRPNEDFSDFLGRWRQTQIYVNQGYEWVMPYQYRHILSEGADETHPLFVVFPETPERIRRGLQGAGLPYITQVVNFWEDDSSDAIESRPAGSSTPSDG